MNKIVKLLMISDIFMVTGSGLIQPILSLYIINHVLGSNVFNIGLASTIFLITKSIIQLPFSKYVDRKGNKIRWLLIGTFISALVPFMYIFSTHIWLIFLAQFLQGIGSGLAYPCWLGLWSVNIDKKQSSYEWSLYATTTGLGTAGAAAVGGAISQYIGFVYTFLLVGAMSVIGGMVLFGLEKKARYRQEKLTKYYIRHKHPKKDINIQNIVKDQNLR